MSDSTQRTQLLHAASFVPIGAFAGKPAMPLTRRVLVVGSGPHARFLLKSDTVSTSHALLIHTASGWYIRDLVSRTHTILNGKSVRESPLHNGDTLTIGKFVFHCAIDGAPAEFTPVAPASLEITDAEIPVPIDTRTVLIGRRVGCEIRLIEESVSLVHAVLFEADGTHCIRDLYSRTGTFLNGKKVHESRLKFGDVIVVGDTTIRYIPDATAGELSPAVATDLSNDSPADLVELEPFGVDATANTRDGGVDVQLDGSQLENELGGSAAGGSLAGGSLAGGSAAGDSFAPRAVDPASLVPIADHPPASSIASAAGIALAEIPPAYDEVDGPAISSRSALPMSPVSRNDDQAPLTIDLAIDRADDVADEPPVISLERASAPDPIDLVEPADEEQSDHIVLPLNSRDMIDGPGPSDDVKPWHDERGARVTEEVPIAPVEAARASDIEAPEPDSASNEDIEADVLGLPVEAESPEAIDLHAIEPEAAAATPEAEAVPAPFVAIEPIAHEPVPESPHGSSLQHEPALLLEPADVDDDHHAPIEPPGVEASVLPQSAEALELAALQARIRQALEDPSTLVNQPLLPETPDAPTPKLSEAGRRARTIAELLESNEEFEEAAERESEAIALPVAEAEIAASSIATDESLAATDAAERTMAAGYELPEAVAAELPPLEPIVEPPAPEIEIISGDRTEDGPAPIEARIGANVVEAAGPAAIAELMRDADAPTSTRDVATDAGELSLAAGESAIVGDEDELVARSPAVDDVARESAIAAAEEPHSEANDDALVIESRIETPTAAPQADDAILAPTIAAEATEASPESPISESAGDVIVEAPAPSPKGRRGRKLPAAPAEPPAPKVRKATPARKPPRGKKAAEVIAEPVAEVATIDPNLAAAAALVASEAQTAIDPMAAALAANVEVATENELQSPTVDPVGVRQSPAAAAPEVPEEASQSDALQVAADLAAAQSRSDDLDTFADRVADAGHDSVASADPDASFIEPAADLETAGPEMATSIGSGEDHTAGVALDATDLIDAGRNDFAGESLIVRDTVETPTAAVPFEFDIAGTDVAPLEASLDAGATAGLNTGTDSLDAIARAAQPDTLEVDEVLVPSRLAIEPDELPTVIEDDRAPVEADAYNAGDVIATSPVEIDEVEVEHVAPMFDPDPGAIAEREALDTKDETTATVVDELGGEHVVVIDDEIDEEHHDLAIDEAAAPRPLRGDDAALSADTEPDELEVLEATEDGAGTPRLSAESEEPADAPLPSRSVLVHGPASPTTSVVNVNVPSMEALETTFHDAFAEALAMADQAEAKLGPPAVAPPAKSTRPPAPKWELDESLLEQAEANAAARKAAPPAPQPPAAGPASTAAAFMSLGGIGWIGDESADEFEQIPCSLRAPLTPPAGPGGMRPMLGSGVGQIGGAMSAARTSRRRRPVPNELEAAVEAAATVAPVTVEETSDDIANEAPTGEPAANEPPSLSDVAAAAAEPEAIESSVNLDELSDLTELADSLPESSSPVVAEEARPVDESVVDLANDGAVAELDLPPPPPEPAPAAVAAPMVIPPRPVRRAHPRARADVDDSLASAASASPFAEHALPLVDAFSGNGVAQPALDEVLAKIGGGEGRIKGHPPITQDRPSHVQASANEPVPSPFASQAPIDVHVDEVDDGSPLPIGHSSVRRARQTINKLPLLLALMVGMMAIAALGAWYVPVPVTVRGELAFTNLDKQSSLDRAAIQDLIVKQKLPKLAEPARLSLDDRYGNGFLDTPDQFSAVKARFEPALPGTLVVEYVSQINQLDSDVRRMNALMKQMVLACQSMVDMQHKLQDAAQAYERSLARDAERRKALQSELEHVTAIAQSGPEVRDIRKAETDTNQADEARKSAAEARDAVEAELKRLEANPLAFVPASLIQEDVVPLLAMLADVSEAVMAPTTRPADPQGELAKLTAQLQSTKARLDQLEAAQSPESKAARDGFDAAMEAFAGDVEAARKQMGDRPELLQYIENARKLQERIQGMTDTMIRRQQQSLTLLRELKQQMAENNGATHHKSLSGDQDLQKWNDQIAINERRLNGARSDNASADEIAKIESQISLLKTMVSGKEEMLKDPGTASVDKKLEDIIASTQKQMEADRSDNDELLAQMRDDFTRQQPAVESLPLEQKKLGESLAGRLAQIDLARQRYTESLGRVAGGEAMQVTELRQKAHDLEVAIATVKPAAEADSVAQAADMERRAAAAKLLDDARAKVLAARTAYDTAAAAYESKSKSLASLVQRRDAASAARQRAEAITAEDDSLKSRMSTALVDKQANEIRLQNAVIPDTTRGPNVRSLEAPRGDPRLMYGAAGLALIGLLFTPLLVRESRHRPTPRRASHDDHRPVMPGNAHAA